MSGSIPGVRAARSLLHPMAHVKAFQEAVGFLLRNRQLVLAMARRDLSNRYAGQVLGIFWSIGHPLFQMAVLMFVFGVVYRQKIGGTYEFPRDYTVYILSGLSAWLSLSPVLSTSCVSVLSNANLIKQFTFDARVLPIKEIVICALVWLVSVVTLIIYAIAAGGGVPWTYALLPVLAAIYFATSMGCAWGLAALSVFLRDMKDVIALVNTVMIYLLPVVYLPKWVPQLFQPLIFANPFSYLIWTYQDVFYYGRIEHPAAWVVAPLFGTFLFTSGYRLFRRLQPVFGSSL